MIPRTGLSVRVPSVNARHAPLDALDELAVVLDIVDSVRWTGRGILSPRSFYEVVYSADGGDIKRVAAKKEFWASGVRSLYSEIEKAVENPVVVGTGRRNWSLRA